MQNSKLVCLISHSEFIKRILGEVTALTTIAVHSFKGGTGKTSISVNMALLLALQGKNVCLVDADFSGPSLNTIFRNFLENEETSSPEYWLNDYLAGKCEPSSFLVDLTDSIGLKGKGQLQVGLANPTTSAMREILEKGRQWQMSALSRMMLFRKTASKELGCDHLIFDTSPGVQYSSVNAIVTADSTLLVVTSQQADLEGTVAMVRGIHESLKKKTYLVANRIPYESIANEEDSEAFTRQISDTIKRGITSSTFKYLGVIPCFCAVALSAASPGVLFSLDNPNHPYVKTIGNLVSQIFGDGG